MKQKITTFLWFTGNAEEAANFYVSLFKNSRIVNIMRYNEAGPGPTGAVMVVTFELEGQEFIALNAEPIYKFTPAISLFVNCDTQAEVDELWDRLSAGGEIMRCGWLNDKFGVSWQITPRVLLEYLQDKDQARAGRVMKAMMQMVKLDIAEIKRAYEGP